MHLTRYNFLSFRSKGRPRKDIDREQLESFLKLKIPISTIVNVFYVSRPTLCKAIRNFNIDYQKFSALSDADIWQDVEVIASKHPNAGEVMVMGHLRARGIHVQRSRVRDAIHHTKPAGPLSHRRAPIRRRMYSVPCPSYVWHIDGNHKLVRWQIVLHRGIDGFSWLVVFGACSTNNKAHTVLRL